MAWIIGGAAVAGALISSNAAGDAVDAQTAAADKASATQLQMYNQNRQDSAPWRAAGAQGLNALTYGLGLGGVSPQAYLTGQNRLADSNSPPVPGATWGWLNGRDSSDGAGWLLNGQPVSPDQVPGTANASGNDAGFGGLSRSFSMSDYQADPGYNFRLQEGLKAINSSAAAKGLLQSGANLKGINNYAQDSASQEYGNAYNRYQLDQSNKFNRLAALSGIGQTAQQQLSQSGMNTANNVSQNQLAAGNASAAGYVGNANAYNNSLSQGVNFYNQNQLLNRLAPQQGMAPIYNDSGTLYSM